ncbi:MAG: class I SAM-dependent methyltransferase [Kiritimatiellaeota bacterium]|nr:class I SAM-dependent methyltransferase [Kiritimatiellota bacterium]
MSSRPVRCRSCGSTECRLIVDLGDQPLANNLLRTVDLDRPEPCFPLRLLLCTDCWLLQLAHTVPPVELFSEYVYYSSFSETMLAHAKSAVEEYRTRFQLNGESFVVEIASNDGYLLQYVRAYGIPYLGVEPAANIAEAARGKGIETETAFFSEAFARKLAASRGRADLILANNVFAHVPDINGFVRGLEILLAPHGRVVLEFPYALDCVRNCEFDTIYHEHVFYFLLTPLLPLFERHNLTVYDVKKLDIHGGSLRIFVGRPGHVEPTPACAELQNDEQRLGADSLGFYLGFSERIRELRAELLHLLNALQDDGKRLAAYGASAKGSTLLNYMQIGPSVIPYIVDRSPHKQNMFSPGMHIPIRAPECLLEDQPDYTLLLTWNFADEILEQQTEYRRRGGKFIIPIPCIEIV